MRFDIELNWLLKMIKILLLVCECLFRFLKTRKIEFTSCLSMYTEFVSSMREEQVLLTESNSKLQSLLSEIKQTNKSGHNEG